MSRSCLKAALESHAGALQQHALSGLLFHAGSVLGQFQE